MTRRRREVSGVKTTIYQAPEFRETAFGFNPDASYRVVWQEESEGRTLDDVWERFQRVDPKTGPWPPAGYTSRSLSIGDVIGMGERLFTVEPVGFRQLGEDEQQAVYKTVGRRSDERVDERSGQPGGGGRSRVA